MLQFSLEWNKTEQNDKSSLPATWNGLPVYSRLTLLAGPQCSTQLCRWISGSFSKAVLCPASHFLSPLCPSVGMTHALHMKASLPNLEWFIPYFHGLAPGLWILPGDLCVALSKARAAEGANLSHRFMENAAENELGIFKSLNIKSIFFMFLTIKQCGEH